jgi:hypothetical protein
MEPIWSLLKSQLNTLEWNPTLRGNLKSAITRRQWPQVRVKAAGWAAHDRCIACLQAAVELDETGGQREARQELLSKEGRNTRLRVVAPQELIDRTPVGTVHHRLWKCDLFKLERIKHAEPSDIARTRDGFGVGLASWER